MYGDLVKNIRENNIKITNEPIVYYWWFSVDIISSFLHPLNSYYNEEKIKYKDINGKKYGLLYIGRAKAGHERLVKYHIYDSSNFHTKGVANGRLSSLRQTLCGLLKVPMSEGKDLVDDFMDNNCYVEWEVLTLDRLNRNEKELIRANYLPLNHQNTKGILTSEHRRILTILKKDVKF